MTTLDHRHPLREAGTLVRFIATLLLIAVGLTLLAAGGLLLLGLTAPVIFHAEVDMLSVLLQGR